MNTNTEFLNGSAFTLDALGDIFTRSFEGYFYPATMSGAELAVRTRLEQLDLHHSLVMRVGGEGIGIALLALRGERVWCGGFGIVASHRGQGFASQLAIAMLQAGRNAGGTVFGLEVLTRNQPAIKTYLRAGMVVTRDLRIVDWHAPAERAPIADDALVEIAPVALLSHFAAMHPVPATWQRDLASLLVRGKMQGLALVDGNDVGAYALVSHSADGGGRLEDFGAQDSESAARLLAALQRRFNRLTSINEPADSPFAAAFDTAGFAEIDRQHEMQITL